VSGGGERPEDDTEKVSCSYCPGGEGRYQRENNVKGNKEQGNPTWRGGVQGSSGMENIMGTNGGGVYGGSGGVPKGGGNYS